MPPRDALALWFLLIALPACVVLAVLVPPGQVPDEPNHLLRAYAVGHGDWVAYRKHEITSDGAGYDSSNVDASWDVYAVATTLPIMVPRPPRMTPSAIERMVAQQWVTPTFSFALGPMANYFPGFYVPAAAGMRFATMLGARPLRAFVSGRLANSLAFVLTGFLALRTARRGRLLLFCGLTMPATLTLAASFNQDGLLSPAPPSPRASRPARDPATDCSRPGCCSWSPRPSPHTSFYAL